MELLHLIGVIPKTIDDGFFTALYALIKQEEFKQKILNKNLNDKLVVRFFNIASFSTLKSVISINSINSIGHMTKYLSECIFSGANVDQILKLGGRHARIFKDSFEKGYVFFQI